SNSTLDASISQVDGEGLSPRRTLSAPAPGRTATQPWLTAHRGPPRWEGRPPRRPAHSAEKSRRSGTSASTSPGSVWLASTRRSFRGPGAISYLGAGRSSEISQCAAGRGDRRIDLG